MTTKLQVFFADLRYFTEGSTFPLGIGFLAATLQKSFPEDVSVKLFVESSPLIAAIKSNRPDIIGLANYSWNRSLNEHVARVAKQVSPRTVVVMGGPAFSRDDPEWLSRFFARNLSLDFFISGAGEFAFEEVVRLLLARPENPVESIRSEAFKGLFFGQDGKVQEGARVVPSIHERRKILDGIQSPYLSGMLDEYFLYRQMGPMIETVRGCPYACTFCCWGSRLLNKISYFSLDRSIAELNYIASRATNCDRLYFGDANFGLLEQDIAVAEAVRDIHRKTGWPNSVFLYMAKNAGERVTEIARILRGLTKVSLARQSLSDDVLNNTKRANLDDATFAQIQKELGESNVESMVELIYPLPGETKESFLDGIDSLFRQVDPKRTEVRMYPAELLPGSELASTESRRKFGLVSAWRKLSGHEAKVDGVPIAEFQEVTLATDSFSLSDQRDIRLFHFMFSMFLTYRLFDPVLDLVEESCRAGSLGIAKAIDAIMGKMRSRGPLRQLIEEFAADVDGELIWTEDLPNLAHCIMDSKEHDRKASRKQVQRRYNIYYALKLLYGNHGALRSEFNDIVVDYLADDLGHSKEQAKAAVDIANSAFVKYEHVTHSASDEVGGQSARLLSSPIYQEFIRRFDGDVVETLYSMYSAYSGGQLGRLVLVRMLLAENATTLESSST